MHGEIARLIAPRQPESVGPSYQPPPPRKPTWNFSIWFQRPQRHAAKAALAMNEHTLMVTEIAKLVRFDFMFFSFGIIDIALAGAKTP